MIAKTFQAQRTTFFPSHQSLLQSPLCDLTKASRMLGDIRRKTWHFPLTTCYGQVTSLRWITLRLVHGPLRGENHGPHPQEWGGRRRHERGPRCFFRYGHLPPLVSVAVRSWESGCQLGPRQDPAAGHVMSFLPWSPARERVTVTEEGD